MSMCTYLRVSGISVIEYHRLGDLKKKALYACVEISHWTSLVCTINAC